MSTRRFHPDNQDLVRGVLPRRAAGWAIDFCLIVILLLALWVAMTIFGFLTFGFGFGAMAILPFVPFLYQFLFLLTDACATPGQQLAGLIVLREEDLGPPTMGQALTSVLVFYLTLATSGLLLAVSLFTHRHRTLHDILSGLVVVRADAIETLTAPPPHWNIRG